MKTWAVGLYILGGYMFLRKVSLGLGGEEKGYEQEGSTRVSTFLLKNVCLCIKDMSRDVHE